MKRRNQGLLVCLTAALWFFLPGRAPGSEPAEAFLWGGSAIDAIHAACSGADEGLSYLFDGDNLPSALAAISDDGPGGVVEEGKQLLMRMRQSRMRRDAEARVCRENSEALRRHRMYPNTSAARSDPAPLEREDARCRASHREFEAALEIEARRCAHLLRTAQRTRAGLPSLFPPLFRAGSSFDRLQPFFESCDTDDGKLDCILDLEATGKGAFTWIGEPTLAWINFDDDKRLKALWAVVDADNCEAAQRVADRWVSQLKRMRGASPAVLHRREGSDFPCSQVVTHANFAGMEINLYTRLRENREAVAVIRIHVGTTEGHDLTKPTLRLEGPKRRVQAPAPHAPFALSEK